MGALSFTEPPERPRLRGASIFLSASIPDPERWHGEFDALEITDAVVAFGRAMLSAGMNLVTAAHPTIAPLLLYVAAELPEGLEPSVSIYQSMIFEDVLPVATRRFESEKIASIHWTEALPDESTDPANRAGSLELMRRQMLEETDPIAACFVGGMEGIAEEFDLVRELLPGAPTYPLGGPGGEARRLAERSEDLRIPELLGSRVYPTVWSRMLDDLEGRSG